MLPNAKHVQPMSQHVPNAHLGSTLLETIVFLALTIVKHAAVQLHVSPSDKVQDKSPLLSMESQNQSFVILDATNVLPPILQRVSNAKMGTHYRQVEFVLLVIRNAKHAVQLPQNAILVMLMHSSQHQTA